MADAVQQLAVEAKSENKPVVKKQTKKEKQQLAAQEKARAMFALLGEEKVPDTAAGVGELPAAKLVEHSKEKKKSKKRKDTVEVKLEKSLDYDDPMVGKVINTEEGGEILIGPRLRKHDERVEPEAIPTPAARPLKRLRHDELAHEMDKQMREKDPWYRAKVGLFIGAAAGAAAYNWAPSVLASFYV